MEHFKKLRSDVEDDDDSNYDLIGATEKFPAQPNNELNYEFSDQELCLLIAKLKNNKALWHWYIGFVINYFICQFCNSILDRGLIPDGLSRGIILPLYK